MQTGQMDYVKCINALVHWSSPVCKLVTTIQRMHGKPKSSDYFSLPPCKAKLLRPFNRAIDQSVMYNTSSLSCNVVGSSLGSIAPHVSAPIFTTMPVTGVISTASRLLTISTEHFWKVDSLCLSDKLHNTKMY